MLSNPFFADSWQDAKRLHRAVCLYDKQWFGYCVRLYMRANWCGPRILWFKPWHRTFMAAFGLWHINIVKPLAK